MLTEAQGQASGVCGRRLQWALASEMSQAKLVLSKVLSPRYTELSAGLSLVTVAPFQKAWSWPWPR